MGEGEEREEYGGICEIMSDVNNVYTYTLTMQEAGVHQMKLKGGKLQAKKVFLGWQHSWHSLPEDAVGAESL